MESNSGQFLFYAAAMLFNIIAYNELLFQSLYFPKIYNYTSLYGHIVSGASVDLTSFSMLVLSIYNYTSLYSRIVSGASFDPTSSAMLVLSIYNYTSLYSHIVSDASLDLTCPPCWYDRSITIHHCTAIL
jgi:hypothetical protein